MSLNLNEYKSQGASSYSSSPEYVDAVNDAQVVRTFSFIALAGSVLIFLGGFLAVGVGIAVMVFGSKRFYRILGLAVVILSIGSFFVPILRLISSVVLCVGVIWKAGAILSTLAGVGKDDPDWQATRNRAMLAAVLSGTGILVSGVWLALFLIASFQSR